MFTKTKDLIIDGAFESSSGKQLPFKIECDALSDASIQAISGLIRTHFKFCEVYGVPNGGTRLAKALEPYVTKSAHEVLIVDDVITTGASFEEARKIYGTRPCIGVAIFSRTSKLPDWVQAVFQLWSYDTEASLPLAESLTENNVEERVRLRVVNPVVANTTP